MTHTDPARVELDPLAVLVVPHGPSEGVELFQGRSYFGRRLHEQIPEGVELRLRCWVMPHALLRYTAISDHRCERAEREMRVRWIEIDVALS